MHNTQHVMHLFENYPFKADSQRVISYILEREEAKFKSEQTKDFAFLSANLGHFMPHLSVEDAYRVYMQVHINRSVMMMETQQAFAIDWLEAVNGHVLTDPQPKIYCAYHLGAYRAPIALLIKKQVNFVLLIDNKTIQGQSAQIEQQVLALKQQNASPSTVILLNAEKDNVIYKLREYIREGFSVLAYIDGNTGQQGVYHRDDKYQVAVPFLKGTIMARAGLAAIAWLTNLPIYPIVTYRPNVTDNRPAIDIATPVIPNRAIPFKQFISDATIALYRVLEDYMPMYYEQWEPWFYIHRYLPNQAHADDETTADDEATADEIALETTAVKFNGKRYELFKIEDECYLLDKAKFLTYPLPSALYQTLKTARSMQTTDIRRGRVSWSKGLRLTHQEPMLDSETLNQLFKRQVFVYG